MGAAHNGIRIDAAPSRGGRQAGRAARRRPWHPARYWLPAAVLVLALAWILIRTVMNSNQPLLADNFNRPDGLVTNEFAYFNPENPAALRSQTWIVTSGSLFVRDHAGWTGIPDRGTPGPNSASANDSVIFRALTRQNDFLNVTVSFGLLVQNWVNHGATPSWQGVHVFLRYQNPSLLYVVSVDRRDGEIVIKKKVPGGPAGAGMYYTLATTESHSVLGRWEKVRAEAVNNGEGGVDLRVWLDGKLKLSAMDNGVGDVAPITHAGRVGLRGDYTQFAFDDFVVAGVQSLQRDSAAESVRAQP